MDTIERQERIQERSTEQQIAELEAQIARLRERKRTEENGQKIILGGMLLASARQLQSLAGLTFLPAQAGHRWQP